MRALEAICATEWLITESALRQILAIANRENTDYHLVAAQSGAKLDYTRRVEMRGTTAVIPIDGPIFRYASLFTEFSGGTTVETVAKDFHAALSNPQVKAILLNIDSPGGQANGIGELAGMIAAGRGQKPIEAYVGGASCSAAYWLASAADRITANEMAMVGCLGARCAVLDPDKTNSREIDFVSSQTPRKLADPRTEQGRGDIQRNIDMMAEVFLRGVAANRGVSYEHVCEHYGQGAVFIGQEALDAGMVDDLGTYEGVLTRLANIARPAAAPQRVAAQGGGAMGLMDKWREFTANLTPEDLSLEMDGAANATAALVPGATILSAAPAPAGMTDEEAAEVQAMREQNATLAARVQQLEADKREARFRAMILGQGGADDGGHAWLGTPESHLTILQALAAQEGGEESPAFLAYCQERRAQAAQEAEAKRLSTLQATYGKNPAPAISAAQGSAMAEIDARVARYQEQHPDAERGAALSAVIRAEPTLYARYQAERKHKIPGVVEVANG